MTAFNKATNSPLLVEVVAQGNTAPALTSHNLKTGSLPSPKGTCSAVADSGRIRFGAGARMPASK
jgi:hypothetical protein